LPTATARRGATGTGKTVTLQVLAEGLSEQACRSLPPTSAIFGIAADGEMKDPLVARARA
jgi:hypothetical protein